MLRTTTVAAARAFKPVQVSAIPRRAYSEDAFKKKETAEEAKYFRQKVNLNQPSQFLVLIVIMTHFHSQSSPGISILTRHVFLSCYPSSPPIFLYDLCLPIASDSFLYRVSFVCFDHRRCVFPLAPISRGKIIS